MGIELKNIEIEDAQLDLVKEQLSLYLKSLNNIDKEDKDLNIVSLFSGCGGMDLGFEGGFKVHKKAISTETYDNFVEKTIDKNYLELKSTRFKTVFANDILKDARNTWVQNFSKNNYKPEVFHTESIVNLVKLHEQGLNVFPKSVDIVTGGFPCQDFSVAGKRNGFNSHRKHDGKLINGDLPTEETRGKLYYWMKRVVEITEPKIFIAENVKGLWN
jgi:DNA (cytosine-5)-methyltransferase 1